MVNSTKTSALARFIVYFIYYPAVLLLASWLDLKYFTPLGLPTLTAPFLFLELGLMAFMGVLLAFPSFILIVKKQGSWKFEWVKVLATSIPIFCYILAPFIFQIPSIGVFMMDTYLLLHVSPLIPVYGIMLGYILLNSFSKQCYDAS